MTLLSALLLALVNLFVGGAVGILLDRLWRRVESVPGIEVALARRTGWLAKQGEPIRKEGAAVVTVRNVGSSAIPPYVVSLYNASTREDWRLWTEHDAELLPEQHDEHHLVLTRNNVRMVGMQKTSFRPEGQFSLRLLMRRSDLVLYEDHVLGSFLAAMCASDKMDDVASAAKSIQPPSQPPQYARRLYRLIQLTRKPTRDIALGCRVQSAPPLALPLDTHAEAA